MPQEDFNSSLQFVLQAEGGYSDTPGDAGGPTNLGIIQTEYDLYRKSVDKELQSVKYITEAEASTIYYNKYWLASHANGITSPLNMIVFDTAVNMGVGTAIKLLCKTLGVATAVQFSPDLSKAVHILDNSSASTILACKKYLSLRKTQYYLIVAGRPVDIKFLKGWMNRLHSLAGTVGIVWP